MVVIFLVVLIPAGLVVFGISRQNQPQPAVNGVTNEISKESNSNQGDGSGSPAGTPQPITQAEQLPAADEKASVSPIAPVSACDQSKKQDAVSARDSKIAGENAKHEREKMRLISKISRRYLDDEIARHQAALAEIETTFLQTIAEANC